MLFNHAPTTVSYSFDDPNLVSQAGLVPLMRLAQSAGLVELAAQKLRLPTDKGANPGAKIASLVGGMAAGGDSIDDMDLLRHGGMGTLFDRVYAPSTMGSFLRKFTFGHVRQLDAVSSRFLARLGDHAPLLPVSKTRGPESMVFVDVDDTVIEIHSAKKQGAGIGYTGIRGLNALLVTATTTQSAPVIIGQRLRKGNAYSASGTGKTLSDALATLGRIPGQHAPRVVRADSAYYNANFAATALRHGAELSVTVRMMPTVKAAIAAIPEHAWTGIEYPQAIYDEATKRWISEAEVAEVLFTAFSSKKENEQVPGRLIVRRIPEKNMAKLAAGQDTMFETYRHHGFFTTIDAQTLSTVEADQAHRGHAVIEQVNAELKAGALAHMPSGIFTANAAWLVIAVITHNLIRAAATIIGGAVARARAASIRTWVITIAGRIARSGRKILLHLPAGWKWRSAFTRLWDAAPAPPCTTNT